jgi:hypothetical protein
MLRKKVKAAHLFNDDEEESDGATYDSDTNPITVTNRSLIQVPVVDF